jgi:hypothetical protein
MHIYLQLLRHDDVHLESGHPLFLKNRINIGKEIMKLCCLNLNEVCH